MDFLGDVRKDVAKFVGDSGACETDERVVEAINDARRVLYKIGDWQDTTDPLCVKPYACTFTLPPEYEYVKWAYICCERLTIQNDWFTPVYGDFEGYCGSCVNPLVKLPGNYATFRDWPTIPPNRVCRGCCPPEGFYIEVQLEDERDCGVELVFQGIGAVVRNVSLTRVVTTLPFVGSMARPGDPRFLWITSVSKPKTYGRIRVYGYDGANRIHIALYDPGDVNPSYARYQAGRANQPLVMKAKKRYRPYEFIPDLKDDKQLCDIHTDALIHALQGISDREGRNIPGYNSNIQMAVAFLNRELHGPESVATAPMRMSRAYKVTGLIE